MPVCMPEKAFHQISLPPADRNFVRLIPVRDTLASVEKLRNLVFLRFAVVVFGVFCSSCLLNHVHIRKHWSMYSEQELQLFLRCFHM